MNAIKTYRRNGQWRVSVHGGALVGGFKTESIARLHGEWYLSTQPISDGNDGGYDPDENYVEGRM